MNAAKLVGMWKKRRQAMALVMVVTTVALMSMLIVAIFSVTRIEYKASQSYVAARSAKQLADLSIIMTEAQLRNAQNTAKAAASRTIHATQPGMVRVYSAAGDFLRAHKLYSSSQMVVSGGNEADIFSTANQVPQDWNSTQNAARFVDLNEPIIRPGLATGTTAVYFPIIDPRAAFTGVNSANGQSMVAVEGFSYTKSTPTITGGGGTVNYTEVVTPADVANEPNKLRLPMPVEWIYILQDGTAGALDSSNKFISADGKTIPTVSNPIVGRVAFWTDDESCKINVNTASEPTFFASPYFFHQRDSKWANFPGTAGEYQRYPGHPATVALSAVLAPGVALDGYSAGANADRILEIKDAIYTLIPKIATGGSSAGTKPFVKDAFSSANGETKLATSGDTVMAKKERLFASVDEMLFADGTNDAKYNYVKGQGKGRIATSIALPGNAARYLFDHDTLERSRFFLTTNSRSPEFSIHGLPRIAMWPIADETLGKTRRTTFDNIIALCATLRGRTAGAAVANSYIFRRAQPHHSTYDVTGSSSDYSGSTSLARNSTLLDYLYKEMTTLQFPQTSSLGSSGDFGTKYGKDNAAQLAIQFFDYIRCTNLYDGVLARGNDGMAGWNFSNNTALTGKDLYKARDDNVANCFTYTEQRITRRATGSLNDGTQTQVGSDFLTDDASVYPGHGQVSPARWQVPGTGRTVQGFGRMFTLSEIGFQFICTADGKNDEVYPVTVNGVTSGGGSAPKAVSTREPGMAPSSTPGDKPATFLPPAFPPRQGLPPLLGFNRWYSNYPPLTSPYGNGRLYGCNPLVLTQHPSLHPGYDPANWNTTLLPNTPLASGPAKFEKRVQAMIMLETFCPMLGWTKMFPEWAIVLDGTFMRSILLNGTQLFPSQGDVMIKSNGNIYEANDVYSWGGHSGPTAMAGGRAGPGGILSMGPDTDPYVSGQARGQSANRYMAPLLQDHDGVNTWGLVSQYVTVDRSQQMSLTFGQRDLVIRIYDSHKRIGNKGQEVQVINIAFTDVKVPPPALVFSGERRISAAKPMTDPAGKQEIDHYYYINSAGVDQYRRSIQAPHWWCFDKMGCLRRWTGTPNLLYKGTAAPPLYSPAPDYKVNFESSDDQVCTGRLDTETRFATVVNGNVTFDNGNRDGLSLVPPELATFQGANLVDENNNPWSGSDVIRTFVPAVGDYRLAAARYSVPSSMWMQHPVWKKMESLPFASQPRSIHSFTGYSTGTEAGCILPTSNPNAPVGAMVKYPAMQLNKNQQLVAGAPYDDGRIPDLPPDDSWAAAANSFGDFDNGIASARDGPYVNKPDEGNFYAANYTRFSSTKFFRSGYFFEPWHNSDDWRTGVYMTPNRMVTSPVMFGSLPTAVWPGSNVGTSAISSGLAYTEGSPWQTLLFRPHASSNTTYGKPVSPGHPGDNNPRDHYLLDLFFMPVVEPYAISEPLSTAGRINLNYQIVPFTNITRATGLHALMKGEFMTTIPLIDAANAKKFYSDYTGGQQAAWSSTGDRFWDEGTNNKIWHRPIDVEKTLYQFNQKFLHTATGSNHSLTRYRGLFRSASQICEIHLIPDVSKGPSTGEQLGSISNITATTSGTNLQSVMEQFWQNHPTTGDNTRERPYSNLYARITTRSNTFRVHMRAQVITKARSVSPDTVDATKDVILGEYRGSAVIERYIDPTDTSTPLPDYAASSSPLSENPLDTYYKYRTLESKRFSP